MNSIDCLHLTQFHDEMMKDLRPFNVDHWDFLIKYMNRGTYTEKLNYELILTANTSTTQSIFKLHRLDHNPFFTDVTPRCFHFDFEKCSVMWLNTLMAIRLSLFQ